MNLLSKFTFSFSLLFVGLFLLQSELEAQISVEHFDAQTTGSNGLSDNIVKDVMVANDGTVWGIVESGPARVWTYHTLFSFKNGEWKTYKELSDTRAIFQDSQGRIWASGYRHWLYENGNWTMTYLENGDPISGVNCITENIDKTLWLGSWDQFYYYDKNYEVWKKQFIFVKQGETMTHSIHKYDERYLFLGKENRLYKWNEDGVESSTYMSGTHALVVDKEGRLYAGYNQGVHVYDGAEWSVFDFGDFDENTYPSVRDIKIEEDGNILIATKSKGLYQVKEGVKTTIVEPNQQYSIYKIALKNDKLYLATSNGLRQYERTTNTWTAHTTKDGLIDNTINHFFHIEDNTFIGTPEGCSLYGGGEWQTLTDKGAVDRIQFDQERNMWLLINRILWKYNGENWESLNPAEGFFPNGANRLVDFLIDRQGSLWIAGWTYISKYSNGQWEVKIDSLPHNYTYPNNDVAKVFFEDSKSRIWMAARNFIQYTDGESTVSFRREDIGYYIDPVHSITEDGIGNIWAVVGRRFLKFDGQAWTSYGDSDGLIQNQEVRDLAVDHNNNIWIGTDRGLSKFDGENFTNYTTEDGLSSNNITTISVDDLNYIWVGTSSNGVDVLTGEPTNIETIEATIISLFPNPSNNTVYLQSTPSHTIQSIRLMDAQGRQIAAYQQIKQQNFSLEVGGYPKGLYFLVIETEKGKLVKRLVLN